MVRFIVLCKVTQKKEIYAFRAECLSSRGSIPIQYPRHEPILLADKEILILEEDVKMCNRCKYHSYLSACCWIKSTTFTMPQPGLQSLDSKLVCWNMQMNRRFVCLGDYCTAIGLMENTTLDLFRPLSRMTATAVKWSSIESIRRVSTSSTT